jgi:fructokinase
VVAVAGEALVDFVPAGRPGLFEAAPGGSAANVAVGLARLEVLVRLLARIANDLLGHRVRTHLAGNGVALSFAVRAAEPTSLARRVQNPVVQLVGDTHGAGRRAGLAGPLGADLL